MSGPLQIPPIRILHLEDDSRDADLIWDLIENGGFEVEFTRAATRHDFESALGSAAVDVVLVDFNVPGYDGMSALRFAKQQQPRVPIIVITGALGEEAAVQCLKEGATDYLLKDRLDRLCPALTRALRDAETDRNRRRAEAELRENQERMAAIFNSSPVAIALGTIEGRLFEVNPEACRLFGYEQDEIVRHPTSELFIWAEPDTRSIIFEKLRAGQRLRNLTAKVRRKSGEIRSVIISMEILAIGNAPIVLGMIIDVTEQKALEARLRRVQRMESIGLLASGIAHDMNNILAPILMGAPLLRMGLVPSETETILSTIESSARRGAALVRHLLIFGRGEEGERRPVNPAALFDEITKITRQTFPRKISIRSHVSDDILPVHGDGSQLHQVLLNLCVNSRDAMPDGGVLSLSAENVEFDEHYSELHPDAKSGRYVLFRVADTGIGIAPEIADRLFDPFFTTKEVGQGTGLGLPNVRGIVKGHGGFVRVHSEVGKGATFEVYFPAGEIANEDSLEKEIPMAIRGAGELILVVDDEENIRSMLRRTLVQHNYKVLTAQNGVEATAIFAANLETALVIADLDMPLIDGINLGRVLRRMNPGIKIVVSTGITERNATDKRVAEVAALGVSAVLTKPYTADLLLRAVSAALAENGDVAGQFEAGTPSWQI